MNKELLKLITIEEALEICLERIKNGEATIEDCAFDFPQHKKKLRDLLPLALSFRSVDQTRPSQAFSKNAGLRLVSKLPDAPVTFWERLRRNLTGDPNVSKRRLRMSQTIAAMIVAVSMLFTGPFDVQASGPGDWLYVLDRSMEQIQLRLNTDPEECLLLRLEFANERLEEAQQKLHQGKMENALVALRAYDDAIVEVAGLIEELPLQTRDTLRTMAHDAIALHTGTLDRIRLSWPEDAQALNAYQKALRNTYTGADRLFGQPEEAPFGPNEEAPKGPNEAAPQGPNEAAPQGPNEAAPQGPNEGAPQGPSEEAPQGPNEEAPQGPNEGTPQGPNEEAPQGPNEGAPQGPTESKP